MNGISMTTIWQRYFLRELSKVFILFLACFYGLYVLVDYSNHSLSFHHYRFSWIDVVRFYGYEFIVRMDILVPFAILIACIKTLCSLSQHRELVALMASGIKLKRLLYPFIFFGLIFTCLIYVNSELLQPKAMKYHQNLDHMRAKEKKKKYHYPHIQQVMLTDESSLIFQRYDSEAGEFFDLYWIRSIDDIYRMRTLSPRTERDLPVGKNVEHLQRDVNGALQLTETFIERSFPEIKFSKETLMEFITSPDVLSLSALKQKLSSKKEILSEKEASLLTMYYYKLALPWLCMLAIIAPAPFCTRFSRTLPVFFIYTMSLFGLVAFYLIMDAALILGERQVFSPAAAIWIPFSIFFAFFGVRFARLN